MTSLPVTIPSGYTILVQKGDTVKVGQPLAKREASTQISEPTVAIDFGEEQVINLSQAFETDPDTTRRFLQKGPGDHVDVGEVVAKRTRQFGLKTEQVLSRVEGTVIRFERDTGRLVIRGIKESTSPPSLKQEPETILSPLAGTIAICNNDAIVIETESKGLVGAEGSGGAAKGEVLVLIPEEGKTTISSAQITKESSGKILLLPSIDKEAAAKAAAIGVAGILGTELSPDVYEYLESRKIDIPITTIDPSVGKKLMKTKHSVIMHGAEKVVVVDE